MNSIFWKSGVPFLLINESKQKNDQALRVQSPGLILLTDDIPSL